MMKRLCALLAFCSIATLLLIACSSTSSTASDPSTSGNQVHMSNTNFVQSSITIKKGERVTLIADTFIPHTIANGTWENGTPKPSKELAAPMINNVSVGGNSSETIGPFTRVGSFKLYCTVHPGMNLTVVVQ
jgi:plastocyanin